MCLVITVDCDRDIEEHFRRSLGRDYCNYLAAHCDGAAACSSASAAPCTGATVTSISRATMSDMLTAEICDSSFDTSKKCSAISVTSMYDSL